MTEGNGQERPSYRVLSIRAIVLALGALVVIGVGVAVWLVLAYGEGSNAERNRLEAIKTAGTIVVGTGGIGALWLAARRQRTSEIALRQKDLDQVHADRAHALQERTAAATQQDAAERRVTDLYTKAADQLGSGKAPVRLAGMYALERLAQSNPDQRQTIVHVLCAYLRMPYTPPSSNPTLTPDTATDGSQGAAASAAETAEQRQKREQQEKQVRLTAQRILAALYRATTRRWVGDLLFCPRHGHAMLIDRAVSTDVLDHGAVVRLAGLARPALRHQECRDPGAAPRGVGVASSGRQATCLVAGSGGLVRVNAAAAPRTTPAPHRDAGHVAGVASPSDRTEVDLPEPAGTADD